MLLGFDFDGESIHDPKVVKILNFVNFEELGGVKCGLRTECPRDGLGLQVPATC